MRARRCESKPRAGRRTVRGAQHGAYPKTPRHTVPVFEQGCDLATFSVLYLILNVAQKYGRNVFQYLDSPALCTGCGDW